MLGIVRNMRTIPVLAGPTASGKSSAALKLAAEFGGEIVTADAMQVYVGMDIGTAKPSAAEQAQVPHHLIDMVAPTEDFSVANWLTAAEQVCSEIIARGNIPIVAGGTGFYISALTNGLPTVPPADPAHQGLIWGELEEVGLAALQAELRQSSPKDADRAGANPRRVVRAVEILRRTGKPPASFPFTTPTFATQVFVLAPPMSELEPRIAERAAHMFAHGLVAEVEALFETYGVEQLGTAKQAIGYKELFDVFAGTKTLVEAEAEVVLRTRQYAKRQHTWFKRLPNKTVFHGTGDSQFNALQQAFTRLFSQ